MSVADYDGLSDLLMIVYMIDNRLKWSIDNERRNRIERKKSRVTGMK